MVAVIIQIIQAGGDYFFVYLWLFVTAFTLFMMVIYPEFIAPLFDRYVPLPEGDLRKQIEELASSIEFPLYKLYVVEGEK
jgi:STE24 endopeptidase